MNHKKELLRSLWVGLGVGFVRRLGFRGVESCRHAGPFTLPRGLGTLAPKKANLSIRVGLYMPKQVKGYLLSY